MANAPKRIALTVPLEMDAVLDRLSVLTNQPKTKLIMEMLEEYMPVLEKTLNALVQIKENKERGSEIAKQFALEVLADSNEKLGVIASEAKNLK